MFLLKKTSADLCGGQTRGAAVTEAAVAQEAEQVGVLLLVCMQICLGNILTLCCSLIHRSVNVS